MANKAILILAVLIFGIGSFWGGFLFAKRLSRTGITDKIPAVKDKSFKSYYIENLAEKTASGKFTTTSDLSKNEAFTSRLFELEFSPNPQKKETRKTTGVINLPIRNSLSPIVIMIRGYVDQSIYTSGTGTKRAAEYFAENGYITVAPDFLGYGGSNVESSNIFEARFQTYTTMVALHKSLDQILQWDGKNIFIWAHSNGGQIALTWIAAESLTYPTVLWAPVTKPFPYSVLYYTDESSDGGKMIRKELAVLEENYEADKFSFTNYFDKIKAPIRLYQGSGDDAVPLQWSNSFAAKLKAEGNTPEYYIYSGDDHNLSRNWSAAVTGSLEFFRKNLKN